MMRARARAAVVLSMALIGAGALAREYRPSSGRYIQFDPMGWKGGPNGYTYANQNPLMAIDPEGLMGQGSGAGAGTGTWGKGGPVRPRQPLTECMKNWIAQHYGPLGLKAVEEASLFSLMPDPGNLLDGGPMEGVIASAAWSGAKVVGVKGGLKAGEIISWAAADAPAAAFGSFVTRAATTAKEGAGVVGPGLILWATTTNELAKQACECRN